MHAHDLDRSAACANTSDSLSYTHSACLVLRDPVCDQKGSSRRLPFAGKSHGSHRYRQGKAMPENCLARQVVLVVIEDCLVLTSASCR